MPGGTKQTGAPILEATETLVAPGSGKASYGPAYGRNPPTAALGAENGRLRVPRFEKTRIHSGPFRGGKIWKNED